MTEKTGYSSKYSTEHDAGDQKQTLQSIQDAQDYGWSLVNAGQGSTYRDEESSQLYGVIEDTHSIYANNGVEPPRKVQAALEVLESRSQGLSLLDTMMEQDLPGKKAVQEQLENIAQEISADANLGPQAARDMLQSIVKRESDYNWGDDPKLESDTKAFMESLPSAGS